jgi:hypothetical protein
MPEENKNNENEVATTQCLLIKPNQLMRLTLTI